MERGEKKKGIPALRAAGPFRRRRGPALDLVGSEEAAVQAYPSPPRSLVGSPTVLRPTIFREFSPTTTACIRTLADRGKATLSRSKEEICLLGGGGSARAIARRAMTNTEAACPLVRLTRSFYDRPSFIAGGFDV